MNDPLEHLEDELRNLQLREPSADMKNAVKRHLAKNKSVFRWWMTGGLATAASLLALILFQLASSGSDLEHEVPIADLPVGKLADDPPPTLFAYNLAARRSPDELNELLDKHAQELLTPEKPVSIRDLVNSELQIK